MRRATQIELFSRKDYAELDALRSRLALAKDFFREQEKAIEQLRTERDTARQQLRLAEQTCAFLHRLLKTETGPVPPLPSRDVLTQLLTVAHPDKWSQGQPATELAHEITVVLNALRTRGEVRA